MTELTTARPRIIQREGRDQDALEIGDLYRKARKSTVASAEYNLQVGQKLTKKKKSLGRGQWLPWLLENADILKFETPRTAQRLMNAANKCDASVAFDGATAAKFNRAIWHSSVNRDEDAEGRDADADENEATPRPIPSLADQCVAAVKKTIERTIVQMRRGHAPRRKFEALFAALTDTLTDLQNETLSVEDDNERIARRTETAEGMGAAS